MKEDLSLALVILGVIVLVFGVMLGTHGEELARELAGDYTIKETDCVDANGRVMQGHVCEEKIYEGIAQNDFFIFGTIYACYGVIMIPLGLMNYEKRKNKKEEMRNEFRVK